MKEQKTRRDHVQKTKNEIDVDHVKKSAFNLIKWDDLAKKLSIEPASKQKANRTFKIELIPDSVTKKIQYTGQRLELKF